MAPPTIDSLIQQLVNANVSFKTSWDPDWAAYSSTYNLRLPATPAIVVLPITKDHVGLVVTYAAAHGLKVQARSGGHSYASYSNGGVDGVIVIDLRNAQSVRSRLPGPAGTTTVNSGCRLGNLARSVYYEMGNALSHGTCADVGVGGHFTHGGFGLFSRAWGLAMDQIVAMEVVTADGRSVTAHPESNPDLFYAIRGAGDSFGIVWSFVLNMQPAPPFVIHWRVDINDVAGHVGSAVKTFQHIQLVTHNRAVVDRRLGLIVSLASDHFVVSGTYLGSRDEFETKFKPALLKGFSANASMNVQQEDWLTSLKLLNQGRDIEVPFDHSAHNNFFTKSIVVREPGLSKEGLARFFLLLYYGKPAPVSYFILIDLYGGADSQISTKDIDFSAFAHRDALWVVQLCGYVSNDEVFPAEGLDFINGLANAMTKDLPKYGAYSNYTDPSLTRQEAHTLYHGEELTRRLEKIKQKWDPNNVFANPQSILPAN
ncbi:putative glucooligosaccharide oxidase [Hypoxylon sp. NC1633]|nr:putative glucooligosaccharide oxidase [Hypoxylon sp. NC1633]